VRHSYSGEVFGHSTPIMHLCPRIHLDRRAMAASCSRKIETVVIRSLPSPFSSKAVASSPKSPVPSASKPRAAEKLAVSANTTPTDVLNDSGSCRCNTHWAVCGTYPSSFMMKYQDSGTGLQFDPGFNFSQ
jgi:hypothetical protein